MRQKAQKFSVVFWDGMDWAVCNCRMTLATANKVARELDGETHVIPVD